MLFLNLPAACRPYLIGLVVFGVCSPQQTAYISKERSDQLVEKTELTKVRALAATPFCRVSVHSSPPAMCVIGAA